MDCAQAWFRPNEFRSTGETPFMSASDKQTTIVIHVRLRTSIGAEVGHEVFAIRVARASEARWLAKVELIEIFSTLPDRPVDRSIIANNNL